MEQVATTYSDADRQRIFDHEFLPNLRAMYNFGFRLTLDRDDARDLVQETFLKAYKSIDSFRQGTNAKAWLFRILKNSFINDYRRKSREPVKVDYQDVENYYNADDSNRLISEELRVDTLRNLMGDEISNALNALDADFRTVILLCDLEGFKYEEIADILEIPIGTVRSRLHRARNLLKEKLTAYAQEMGYNTKAS